LTRAPVVSILAVSTNVGDDQRLSRRFDDAKDACGMGFLASRQGVAERRLIDIALDLCRQFDHRGAPGHGAGLLLDIPWPLLLDRFPDHVRLIAQRDVALGMFFLPFDAVPRRRCVKRVEELASLAEADVLGWADVPVDLDALPAGAAARRTAPVVRQALFRRPAGMSEDGWLACRYLLRLALDEVLSEEVGHDFSIASLSNRTVVYKGLAELSQIARLYPDLVDPHFASRFVLFHSRYSTNTTTAWRRAQPFWALGHNGEISTIRGNVAWMEAIGPDLVTLLVERHPRLARIGERVRSIICAGGSDTANLDDMVIALLTGGLSLPQAILALLPEAPSLAAASDRLTAFHEAMSVFLGACDGPAAVVACDGDEAVAHLDRNGLRPLWLLTTKDYAVAASELTGTLDLGTVETQKLFGPGDTVVVNLKNGDVLQTDEVHRLVSGQRFPVPSRRIVVGAAAQAPAPPAADLRRTQIAFGMTREDEQVLLAALAGSGKPAVGSMGDDTPPAAMLDRLPRRLEEHFKLRFAQETSPPIDPIRDAWVFETGVALGDRSGLWRPGGKDAASGPVYMLAERILSLGELGALETRESVARLELLFEVARGPRGLEAALDEVVSRGLNLAGRAAVVVLSDRGVDGARAALPVLRAASRLHDALVKVGLRHRVGIVADAGVWDIHHAAVLIAVGADALCPWLGCLSAGEREATYLKGLRGGFVEAMSMMGVTPASAYCGAKLIEAVGLDPAWLRSEFPGVARHLGGIGPDVLDREWLGFHAEAFQPGARAELADAGEFRYRSAARPHANNPDVVRTLHAASGYAARGKDPGGSRAAYETFARTVNDREPLSVLDLLRIVPHAEPIALDEVEAEEHVLWRFMAPGMSEGAISQPAHRAVARAMNALHRYCLARFRREGVEVPPGIGPIANSGEGGFDKSRIGRPDGNRSIQYAGARFTVTPMTAARVAEAEVKFAQGAKPGKGGQLPGKKVSPRIAQQRGCEPGYELVSPPVNHNLYSIEDVKLMVESWRHLNPDVRAALKFVATHGVEMACMGGVNAGANRLHLSDGCGGTGAAKRVDQKHGGVPVAAVLPAVQDMLVEEGVRERVELSVDGGVLTGEHALKLMLLGADRVGFGTSVLMSIGCSMLRQCHLAGPQPGDTTGKRRQGCTLGVATQDPALVARFSGKSQHVTRLLRHVAGEVREQMAALGIRRLAEVIGRRDLLEKRSDLTGKAALVDVGHIVGAPPARALERDEAEQRRRFAPPRREEEEAGARRALCGEEVELKATLTNVDRCVAVGAAGIVARRFGDDGLPKGRLVFRHRGAAGHFYGAYALGGMELYLQGLAADSAFTAAYGGKLVVVPEGADTRLTVVGNTFGYGARAGRAYLAGRGGNRFGICMRKSHEGTGPRVVVEGVEANAFQYMTGGVALVLGSVGFNLGAGLTGGRVYLFELDGSRLNRQYVKAEPLDAAAAAEVEELLREHAAETASPTAERLLRAFDPGRFSKVTTAVAPEPIE
jgi:glutamate synthase domain-containing protein 2/glutamate synthase domain-containing protein 1/glutamate synthase domain-containing protein 3